MMQGRLHLPACRGDVRAPGEQIERGVFRQAGLQLRPGLHREGRQFGRRITQQGRERDQAQLRGNLHFALGIARGEGIELGPPRFLVPDDAGVDLRAGDRLLLGGGGHALHGQIQAPLVALPAVIALDDVPGERQCGSVALGRRRVLRIEHRQGRTAMTG